jgi:hypothetical protein
MRSGSAYWREVLKPAAMAAQGMIAGSDPCEAVDDPEEGRTTRRGLDGRVARSGRDPVTRPC